MFFGKKAEKLHQQSSNELTDFFLRALPKSLRDNFPEKILTKTEKILLSFSSVENILETPTKLFKTLLNFKQTAIPVETLKGRRNRNAKSAALSHCQATFLKTLFIRSGYIQNPKKAYHLEITIKSKFLSRLFIRCCRNMNITFKKFIKNNSSIFYLKNRKKISRFLNSLELFEKAMAFEDIIATRTMIADINRQVNFETANINKQVKASEEICNKIRSLLNYTEQSVLSDSLRQIAEMRLHFPHDTIEKLGKRLSPVLSKSAVNHRLRRIEEIFRKIFEKDSH
ncbi:MAG: DNA-binding protein WhiA [Candidatus Riflebacteria bacterium]|nr:DNA-binding protein WhiA [Candidatus Riflebacteria bacterium]